MLSKVTRSGPYMHAGTVSNLHSYDRAPNDQRILIFRTPKVYHSKSNSVLYRNFVLCTLFGHFQVITSSDAPGLSVSLIFIHC